MTWQLEKETGSSRTEFKVVKGVRVERLQRHGLHYTSMTGRNAVGTYARPRWATVHFKCLGQTFTTWGGVVEFLNDAEAVQSAKAGRAA